MSALQLAREELVKLTDKLAGKRARGTQDFQQSDDLFHEAVVRQLFEYLNLAIAAMGGGTPATGSSEQDEAAITLGPGDDNNTFLAASSYFGYSVELKGPDQSFCDITTSDGTYRLQVETNGQPGNGFARYNSVNPTSNNMASNRRIQVGPSAVAVQVVRYFNV